jgi:hypothetical protein
MTPISVSANQNSTGANITVPSPASSTTPNVEFLGTGGQFAFVTGDVVARGANTTVLVFGPGLASGLQVSFSGPNDIAISNVQSITATDGTPGLQFNIAVDSNAAFGARTLILHNSANDDITTFAGALEVQ